MTDLARYQDPLTIQRVLHTASTIAIVGLSNNELRASYFVGYYLRRHGYRVIPVNPRETEILGQKCYASLLDIPEPVDIVNVFRAPDALPGIAREAVAIHAGALWCQFGVINEEAKSHRTLSFHARASASRRLENSLASNLRISMISNSKQGSSLTLRFREAWNHPPSERQKGKRSDAAGQHHRQYNPNLHGQLCSVWTKRNLRRI